MKLRGRERNDLAEEWNIIDAWAEGVEGNRRGGRGKTRGDEALGAEGITGTVESGAIVESFRDETRAPCATIDRRSNRFDTPTPVPISGRTSYTRSRGLVDPAGPCASFSFRHHLSPFSGKP